MTDEDLARAAYDAYGTSTGGLTHDGRRMPDWADLGDAVQAAWVAAAARVRELAGGGRA